MVCEEVIAELNKKRGQEDPEVLVSDILEIKVEICRRCQPGVRDTWMIAELRMLFPEPASINHAAVPLC